MTNGSNNLYHLITMAYPTSICAMFSSWYDHWSVLNTSIVTKKRRNAMYSSFSWIIFESGKEFFCYLFWRRVKNSKIMSSNTYVVLKVPFKMSYSKIYTT